MWDPNIRLKGAVFSTGEPNRCIASTCTEMRDLIRINEDMSREMSSPEN
jgi:hypothetical protein